MSLHDQTAVGPSKRLVSMYCSGLVSRRIEGYREGHTKVKGTCITICLKPIHWVLQESGKNRVPSESSREEVSNKGDHPTGVLGDGTHGRGEGMTQHN